MDITIILANAVTLVQNGVELTKSIMTIVERAKAGVSPTDAELDAAQADMQAACVAWDAAADKDRV